MKKCYVWITLVTDAMADVIVAKLVRDGYGVCALAKCMTLGGSNTVSSVFAFSITREEDFATSKVLELLQNLMQQENIKYHSMIVTQAYIDTTWAHGNIKLSELPKKKKSGHLTVVTPLRHVDRGPFANKDDDGIIDDTKKSDPPGDKKKDEQP